MAIYGPGRICQVQISCSLFTHSLEPYLNEFVVLIASNSVSLYHLIILQSVLFFFSKISRHYVSMALQQ